jgi:hypothetical protein
VHRPPSPLERPTLRDDLPRYPYPQQLLRVTGTTIPGPAPGTLLYVSSTQQLRTDTLTPRDREPCWACDPNRLGLSPGFYLGRLAGSYGSLPVYEVISAALAPAVLPGLTEAQLISLQTVLSQSQITNLNNLNACQLQVLLQLAISSTAGIGASTYPNNLYNLTSNFNATQLANIVANLTYTQLSSLVNSIWTSQTVVVASSYPALYQLIQQSLTATQVNSLLMVLNSQQISTLINLTASQLQAIAQLNSTELQLLTSLTATQVGTVVGAMTANQLKSILDVFGFSLLTKLANALTADSILEMLKTLTADQILALTRDLTIDQLQKLSTYPASTITALTTYLSPTSLGAFLSLAVPPPDPVLGNQQVFGSLPAIIGQPSSTPSVLFQGYTPLVVDSVNNQLYMYNGAAWSAVGGSTAGPRWLGPFTIGFATVKAVGGFTADVNLGHTIAANAFIDQWYAQWDTAWLGGTIALVGAKLYNDVTATDITTDFGQLTVAAKSAVTSTKSGAGAYGPGDEQYPAAAVITKVRFTEGAAQNLNQLTQGSVKIWVREATLP